MAYNSNDRSERLLQGRRFTTDNLTLVQEAFTDVFDLGATEIYTDDGLIPTGSSQLPYNSAADDQKIVSGSVVDPTLNPDLPILRYHFRHKMRPAADAEREVYYFTTSEPSSPTDTAGSDQLIETDQETNFVSPKYIVAADSSKNTEANPPGYKVIVFKDASATAGGVTAGAADPADYVFDFKTGVLSWKQNKPSDTQYVYITVYQYIGRTLRSQIDDGSIGGGGDFTAAGISGSWQGQNFISASQVTPNLPTNTVSGSAQIIAGLPANTVSGSSQVSYLEISNVPANIVSSSAQIATDISGASATAIGTAVGAVTSSLTIDKGVVFTDANGQLQQEAGFTYDSANDRLSVNNLTTTTFTASFITSSIVQASGSNIFGDEAGVDTQKLIGQVTISGSALGLLNPHQITGSLGISGSLSFTQIDCGTF